MVTCRCMCMTIHSSSLQYRSVPVNNLQSHIPMDDIYVKRVLNFVKY